MFLTRYCKSRCLESFTARFVAPFFLDRTCDWLDQPEQDQQTREAKFGFNPACRAFQGSGPRCLCQHRRQQASCFRSVASIHTNSNTLWPCMCWSSLARAFLTASRHFGCPHRVACSACEDVFRHVSAVHISSSPSSWFSSRSLVLWWQLDLHVRCS